MAARSRENRSAGSEIKPDEESPADVLRRLHATPEIFSRIADWKGAELALQERLRGDFPEDIVRAALSLVELRARGS
jgi:hypothetical protein